MTFAHNSAILDRPALMHTDRFTSLFLYYEIYLFIYLCIYLFIYCIGALFTTFICKKAKQSRYTPWRRLGGEEYSSYSFSTSALDGVSGQCHAPAALLPPVPIVQEAGWTPEPVWTQRLQEKSFAPAGNRTPIARSSSP
jgi:hypothetical protein